MPTPGNAEIVGESGSLTSGPGVRITLRLDAAGRVASARFETANFDAAREVAAALCAHLLGRSVEEAGRFTMSDLAASVGRPVAGAVLRTVHFAKSAALQPILGRAALHGPGLTCTCFQVATDTIRRVVREHAPRDVADLQRYLPAGTGCGTCRPDLERLIAERT